MDYEYFKNTLLENLEKNRDSIITNYHCSHYDPDLLFEISDSDDKLYNHLLTSSDMTIQRSVVGLLSDLLEYYRIPFEQTTKNLFDFQIVMEDGSHFVEIRNSPKSLNSGSIHALIDRTLSQADASVDIVFLVKDNEYNRKNVIRFAERIDKLARKFHKIIPSCYIFENYLEKLFDYDELLKFQEAMINFNEEMHKVIGYQITEICTPYNLEKMRQQLLDDIPSYNYEEIRNNKYVKAKKEYPRPFFITQDQFDGIKDVYLGQHNDSQKARYKLLLGNSNFANSFLTSEWLYKRYVEEGSKYDSLDLLDNTFIASGYLKSIEQLLWDIIYIVGQGMTINRKKSSKEKGSKGKDSKVKLTDDNESEIDTTLWSLGNFLYIHADDDLFQQNKFVVRYLNSQLNDWRSKNRNGYFHKDNMKIPGKLKAIKDDTYFLYMLILGSIKMDESQLERL